MAIQITKNTYLLAGAPVAVTFSDNVTKINGNAGKELTISTKAEKSAKIWSWGNDNLLPQRRETLISENNIIPELLRTKRDITVGNGLFAFREKFVDGKRAIEEVEMPREATAFFDSMGAAQNLPGETAIRKFLQRSATNFMVHANTFTEGIRDKGGRIISLKALKARHVRLEKQDEKGVVNSAFWSGNWKEKGKAEFKPMAIPMYAGEKARQPKFIYHVKDDVLSDDYLGIPTWWGGRSWIEVANAIPVFHIQNLRNGYNIRYHIEVPKDYFWDYSAPQQTAPQQTDARQKETAAKEAFLSKLNDFLAGLENAGRALVTEYELNKSLGKDFPGIKITPLAVDLKDEALLKLFERSNEANISGQGVHPTLAAIQTQGKLSSGSEIRNAFLLYVAIKTPVARQSLLEPLELVKKVNGWPSDVKFGFRDIEITKLDENPAAKQDAIPTA